MKQVLKDLRWKASEKDCFAGESHPMYQSALAASQKAGFPAHDEEQHLMAGLFPVAYSAELLDRTALQ